MKFPEIYRFNPGGVYNTNPGDTFGMFIIPKSKSPSARILKVIACDGNRTQWEHVSVSVAENKHSTPTWEDMCFVKDLFWDENEDAIQFHPAKADYVNFHPGCLHLWRPVFPFPKPSPILVGPPEAPIKMGVIELPAIACEDKLPGGPNLVRIHSPQCPIRDMDMKCVTGTGAVGVPFKCTGRCGYFNGVSKVNQQVFVQCSYHRDKKP